MKKGILSAALLIDRDALRLSAETIAFAGVKAGMKIAELFPR
jgi:predicted methyltransferase